MWTLGINWGEKNKKFYNPQKVHLEGGKGVAFDEKNIFPMLNMGVALQCFGVEWHPAAQETLHWQMNEWILLYNQQVLEANVTQPVRKLRLTSTTEQRSNANLKIHHEWLQEMQGEAFGMALTVTWLEHDWKSVGRAFCKEDWLKMT